MLDLWSPSGTDARIGATTQSGVDNAQLLLTTNGQNTWTVTAKRSTNQFEITSAGGGGVYLSSGGTSWNSLSDLRLKANISTLASSSLDQILALNPVTYDWISAVAPATTQIGFVAQEVQAIFPQLVSNSGTSVIVNADGSTTTVANTLGMNYTGLIPPMVRAIQELNLKLEDLATTTPELKEGSFPSRFFTALKDRLIAWFTDATNGITDFFAKIGHFDEVCAKNSDGTETCVDGDQLKALLGSAAAGAQPTGGSSGAPTGDASAAGDGTADDQTGTTTAAVTSSPSDIVSPSSTDEEAADAASDVADAPEVAGGSSAQGETDADVTEVIAPTSEPLVPEGTSSPSSETSHHRRAE
jgi:hypothetical protein